MLAYLLSSAKVVLDVGCSIGHFGQAIKHKSNLVVWVFEPFKRFGKLAVEKLDKVFISSVEGVKQNLRDNYFDGIYFNHVLKHLLNPHSVVEKIKPKLKDDGRIIRSIPNI